MLDMTVLHMCLQGIYLRKKNKSQYITPTHPTSVQVSNVRGLTCHGRVLMLNSQSLS